MQGPDKVALNIDGKIGVLAVLNPFRCVEHFIRLLDKVTVTFRERLRYIFLYALNSVFLRIFIVQ